MKLMNRARLAVLAATAVFTLAGCGSTTTHEPTELKKIREVVEGVEVWSIDVGESLTGLLTPVVTPNAVFAAGEQTIYRLNPSDGETVWKVELNSPITAGVGSDGHVVAVATAAGELEVFDEDGKALWKVKLSSEMNVPPLIGSGFVIVRTADTRVTAFDAMTGERKWRYQAQTPALTVRSAAQMRFSPAGVLIGQANGRLLALNAQGSTVFDAVIAQPKGITEVERLCDVVGTPLVDAQMMCAAAFQGNVLCMSAKNGRTLWRNEVDAVTGPVSDGERVFVVTSRGEINAYDYQTGKPLWVNKDLTWRTPSAPVVMDRDVIALGDFDGEIHLMDSRTGEIIGRTDVDGAVRVQPVPMGEGALIQTVEGELTYLRIEKKE